MHTVSFTVQAETADGVHAAALDVLGDYLEDRNIADELLPTGAISAERVKVEDVLGRIISAHWVADVHVDITPGGDQW